LTEKKDNTVQVLYSFFDEKFTEWAWEINFRRLPENIQAKVMRYRRWEDRQAKMLGHLLLREGLSERGFDVESLGVISTEQFGRPYVRQNVDFNVSHSGDYVVCAVSEGTRVGIDIEKRRAFSFSDLAECFTEDEQEELMNSENRTVTFYDLWTMKESVLKADGRGLFVPLSQVVIEDGLARLNGAKWFLTKLDFGADYSCHLATSTELATLELDKMEFDSDGRSPRAGELEAEDGDVLRPEHSVITQNGC
jgi:4'-phosphopantetheinyl transferase